VLAVLATACLLASVPEPVYAQAAAPADAQTRPLTPEETQRMRKLEEELRCLVCQNQTLADSKAGLADDLRRQVRDLVAQGKSNEEIKDYLVQRYGDFVLYRPRVKTATYLLWFGPFALLLVGAGAWLVVQRRSRKQASQARPTQAVDPEERDRARKLLDA